MAHSRNLRKGRWSEKGRIYLITFTTKNRDPIFQDLWLARALIRCINQSPHASTLAFVVMPDHVHWLICLDGQASLSRTVQSAKAISSRTINRINNTSGSTWQSGFHDHAVRNEKAVRDIARYVVANPVKAGLVDSVGEYPHWDAAWF